MKNKKQKKDVLYQMMGIVELMELRVLHALKSRVSECDEDQIPCDDLCNTIYEIGRQASLLSDRVESLLVDNE